MKARSAIGRPSGPAEISSQAGKETVRAFALFAVLLLALTAIGVQLMFRELSLKVLQERLDLGSHTARVIADAVRAAGQSEGGIDFSKVRVHEAQLKQLIRQQIRANAFVRYVEVRDRFDLLQLSEGREGAVREPPQPDLGGAVPVDWPPVGEQMVRVQLPGDQGSVSLSVSQEAMLSELDQLRNSLQIKVAIAAGASLLLLVAGFYYILYLLRRNRDLEQSRQSAARASYVGLLASGLAHEIRNPLNAMSMNLQMLEEELQQLPQAGDGEHAELLESSKREIERLERLVNNFLAYARPVQPRFKSRDLNDVVREVVRFLDVDFRQSKVELALDLEPLLPTVEIDETQFKQALINLLVNARQVLSEGGHVTVHTRAAASGEVVLEVEDDGPGIPAELRERIFEVFYSSRGGGTGLGLPIARQVIERHGGSIEIDSEIDRGTTFRIRLQRRHSRESRPAEPVRGRR